MVLPFHAQFIFYLPARLLHFLSYESSVRRSRPKYLQTLPNFWKLYIKLDSKKCGLPVNLFSVQSILNRKCLRNQKKKKDLEQWLNTLLPIHSPRNGY